MSHIKAEIHQILFTHTTFIHQKPVAKRY